MLQILFTKSGEYKSIILLFSLLLSFSACKDEFDNYYSSKPEDLGPPIIEMLKSDPDYSLFVSAIERCKLSDILKKGAVYTVFAPLNQAIEKYQNDKGISLSEINQNELYDIISYHITYGLHYKYGVEKDYKKNKENSYETRYIDKANHQRKKLSVYGGNYLNGEWGTKNYSKDYAEIYQYPEKEAYIGTLNANGAQIVKSKMDIDCENGVLHGINRLLIPPLRVDSFLNVNPEFSIYAEILNRFDTLIYDAQNSYIKDGVEYKAYKKNYNREKYSLNFNLADEEQDFTAFIPTNTAMESFFNNPKNGSFGNILKRYKDGYNSIPDDIWQIFIKNTIAKDKKLKLDMENDYVKTESNDIYGILKYLKKKPIPLSNGILYPIEEMLAPPELISVAGHILLDPDYSDFKFALIETGLLKMISKSTYYGTKIINGKRELLPVSFTLMAPNNRAFEDAEINVRTMEQDELINLIKYHIIEDTAYIKADNHKFDRGIFSRKFKDGYYKTANKMYFKKSDTEITGVYIDKPAEMYQDEKYASNGVVHPINNVLIPPDSKYTLFNLMKTNPDIGIMVAEIENNPNGIYTDIISELKNTNVEITFLCPTDAAINLYNTVAAVRPDLTAFGDMTAEQKVIFIKNHIVRGRFFTGTMGANIETWSLAASSVYLRDAGYISYVKDSHPLTQDAVIVGRKNDQAKNGVIQPIDKVMLPKKSLGL